MSATICSVTFEIDSQPHRSGQFSVPKAVCDILGLRPGDQVALIIKTPKVTFEATKPLSSGTEVYGPEIAEYVEAGTRLRITAARPT